MGWEQQDRHEVANNMIFVDLGMISGLVSVSFWDSKCIMFFCMLRLVCRSFVHCFLIRCFVLFDFQIVVSHGRYYENHFFVIV